MNRGRQKALTAVQLAYLCELGLSNHAIALYESLLAAGTLTANAAADQRQRFASAQYRLFYQLESHGLARRISNRPVTFQAVSPEMALPTSLNRKEERLKSLLHKTLSGKAESQTVQVRIIIGRQALYDEYAIVAPTAQRTIRVYAIGIAYSDKLVAVQRAAVERGVRVQHIAQQLKPSNFHVLHTWRKLGVDVRLSPSERGFHFMLFDDASAIISFSDPANTDDRLSIVTDNPTAVKLFGNYFHALWQEAREVDV